VSAATAADWLVHLDEETQFDRETVWAIFNFIQAETTAVRQKQRQWPRIGQGIILYGARGVVNWITTLADSIRVGDDYGRFRLQFEHGKAVFGIHGSFIVVNNGVEQQVGLDHGPAASITEDAYFALVAQSMGIEFGFIHTYMYEKSPFSVKDFIKQRHRWFGGLWYCALDKALPWRDRILLATFMVMWSVSWLCIAMVYINLLYPTGTPVWLAIAGRGLFRLLCDALFSGLYQNI
jgi:egghead protein (zeste-white 4 protein)